MSRFLFVACLIGAVLAWPTSAAAQTAISGCQDLAFIDGGTTTDAQGRLVREIRGRAGNPIEVRCGEMLLIADEIDFIVAERRLVARGSVVFQQTATRIAAAHGEFDLQTRTGFFREASGTLKLTDREIDKTFFGAQEPEAIFSAELIEKTGPATYRLTNAVFSACVQPTRRWEMTASRLTFTVDKYAVLKGAVLRVKDVPLLYLPVFYYPIQEDGRATGFLMPSYGSSTFRGFSLSNAFFWALGRSHDATLYHDWFASTGQGMGADYRYIAGPNSRGDAKFYMIREKAEIGPEGTVTSPARRSYEVRGNVSQALPGRIRLQMRADYFTDAEAQQLYQVDFNAVSRRESYFGADASGNWGRLRFFTQAERRDTYYGTSSASSTRYQPRVNLSVAQTPIAGTKITLEGGMDAISVVRFTDLDRPETRLGVRRTDGSVTLRAPLSLGTALTLSGSASVRRTDWNISRDPESGAVLEVPISRSVVELRGRIVGPVFTRVFNTPGSGFAERYKHVIEPAVTVTRTSAFDRFAEIVQTDGVDAIIGGDTRVNYGITNTLLARVRQGDQQATIRPVLKLEVSQTYYTKALAAVYDSQYQSSFGNLFAYATPESNFSPVRAQLDFTPSPTLGGQFFMEYDTQFRAARSYRVQFRIARPVVDFGATWSKRQVIPGLQYYDDPLRADQFLILDTGLKRRSGGASLNYSMTYDVLRNSMLQQRLTGFYNAQCCGVAVDYAVTNQRQFGFRDDKRFSLSFTLAGVGSFTNLLGVFGNNGTQR